MTHKTMERKAVAKIIEDRHATKRDFVTPITDLQFRSVPGVGDSFGLHGVPLNTTATAEKQICGHLGIPFDFFTDTMVGAEKEMIVNRLVEKRHAEIVEKNETARRKSSESRTFRFHATPNGMELYGVVSEKYSALDNVRIAEWLRDTKATHNLEVVKGTGLHPDYSRVRLIAPDIKIGGHTPMIDIANSENGLNSFAVTCGIYSFICTNGLVVKVQGTKEYRSRFIHLGNVDVKIPDPDILIEIAVNNIKTLVEAEKTYIGTASKVKMANWMGGKGIIQKDVNGIIDTANRFYRGGDTVANVVGSMTQYAQEYNGEHLSRRADIERVAGELLATAPRLLAA